MKNKRLSCYNGERAVSSAIRINRGTVLFCRKVEKQFDKFILANEELTLYVQKKYPKIRAEYAVFDRMIMFTEEDKIGYARKEFQTLEEVEKYYEEIKRK